MIASFNSCSHCWIYVRVAKSMFALLNYRLALLISCSRRWSNVRVVEKLFALLNQCLHWWECRSPCYIGRLPYWIVNDVTMVWSSPTVIERVTATVQCKTPLKAAGPGLYSPGQVFLLNRKWKNVVIELFCLLVPLFHTRPPPRSPS